MKIMSYEIILLVINKTLSSVMRYLCIYSTYEVGPYNENKDYSALLSESGDS